MPGTITGAGNGDPQAVFIAIAWLEAVRGNGLKPIRKIIITPSEGIRKN
jgi:hypothetical protein